MNFEAYEFRIFPRIMRHFIFKCVENYIFVDGVFV